MTWQDDIRVIVLAGAVVAVAWGVKAVAGKFIKNLAADVAADEPSGEKYDSASEDMAAGGHGTGIEKAQSVSRSLFSYWRAA